MAVPTRNRKISRRVILQLAGLGAGSSILAGSPRAYAQAAGDVDKAIAWAKVNLPNSTPEIINTAAKEGKLTLMLQPLAGDEAIAALVGKFMTRYPFIDTSYTTQTSTQIMSKFSAEVTAKKGINDYVQFPSNLKETNNYIEAGNILKFVVSQDATFPDTAKQSGIWYAWLRQHGVTAYRASALSAEEKKLVQTYKGLGDPRFKGRIGINNINNSVAVTGAYILMQGPDTSIWDKLVLNKPIVKPSSPSLIDGVLGGQYDIALMSGFSTAAIAAKGGAPLEFVISAPSPALYAPGAISALAPHPNAARLFQDWAMSKEGQEVWSAGSGSISARGDVVGAWSQQQPWFFEDLKTHQPIDWSDFTSKESAVIARFKKDLQAG